MDSNWRCGGGISAKLLLNAAVGPSFLLTPADLLHALLAHENPCLLCSELLAGTQFPGTEAGGNLKKPSLELFFSTGNFSQTAQFHPSPAGLALSLPKGVFPRLPVEVQPASLRAVSDALLVASGFKCHRARREQGQDWGEKLAVI